MCTFKCIWNDEERAHTFERRSHRENLRESDFKDFEHMLTTEIAIILAPVLLFAGVLRLFHFLCWLTASLICSWCENHLLLLYLKKFLNQVMMKWFETLKRNSSYLLHYLSLNSFRSLLIKAFNHFLAIRVFFFEKLASLPWWRITCSESSSQKFPLNQIKRHLKMYEWVQFVGWILINYVFNCCDSFQVFHSHCWWQLYRGFFQQHDLSLLTLFICQFSRSWEVNDVHSWSWQVKLMGIILSI